MSRSDRLKKAEKTGKTGTASGTKTAYLPGRQINSYFVHKSLRDFGGVVQNAPGTDALTGKDSESHRPNLDKQAPDVVQLTLEQTRSVLCAELLRTHITSVQAREGKKALSRHRFYRTCRAKRAPGLTQALPAGIGESCKRCVLDYRTKRCAASVDGSRSKPECASFQNRKHF